MQKINNLLTIITGLDGKVLLIINSNKIKVVVNVNSQIANNYFRYIHYMKICISIQTLVIISIQNEIHGRAALEG